jgi:hypothetical protein
METSEEGVGVHSLVRNTLGVEGHAKPLSWGLRRVISGSLIHMDLHKPNNKFGARTHKTQHYLNLGEAITFPPIVLFVLGHMACTQMSFCVELPSWESRNSLNSDSWHFESP